MEYNHIPVMLCEAVEGLRVKENGVYVDGTLGGGGHSLEIAKRLTCGRLIANDLDDAAINKGKETLANYLSKVSFIKDDYKNITKHLDELNISLVDGILIDMGVSSYQIDLAERGFSYMKDAPLDMRMNSESSLTAKDIVNEMSESELKNLFFKFGEERFSKRIAERIVEKRKVKPIETTLELSNLIINCYPFGFKDGHPAKKVFQAIRIEVNSELNGLYESLIEMARRLKSGGRMAVITFHSLEDRIVKNAFRYLETDCECDKNMPICICKKRKEVNIITKKPITARNDEIENNKRAQSAKLRIIEKL